jgi:hypothetical protein
MAPFTVNNNSMSFSLPDELTEKFTKHCEFVRIDRSELLGRILTMYFENPDPVLDSFGDLTKRAPLKKYKKRRHHESDPD